MGALPRLYTDLAPWFHQLTAPADYASEAEYYHGLIVEACDAPPRAVLELGSGGGNNASHMKAHFDLTLVDLSPAMLALSRGLNAECEHVTGDIRNVRLGRSFDAVFVHDAVMYMTTEADLRAAIETAFAHCRPGGVALFAPDHVREAFHVGTTPGGHDGADGRALRYLEWVWDPDPDDTSYLVEFAILLREADGSVRLEHDRHTFGMFPRETWLRLLVGSGFDPTSVISEDPEVAGEVFVCVRPAAGSSGRQDTPGRTGT